MSLNNLYRQSYENDLRDELRGADTRIRRLKSNINYYNSIVDNNEFNWKEASRRLVGLKMDLSEALAKREKNLKQIF